MIKLEVGKFYKTRAGKMCKIIDFDETRICEYIGLIGINNFYFYYDSGMTHPTQFKDEDIISEWQEPEQEEQPIFYQDYFNQRIEENYKAIMDKYSELKKEINEIKEFIATIKASNNPKRIIEVEWLFGWLDTSINILSSSKNKNDMVAVKAYKILRTEIKNYCEIEEVT